MKEITTHPNRKDWITAIVFFPMYVLFAAILPWVGLNYFYLHSPTGKPPLLLDIAAFIFGAVVAFWFFWRIINRQYWQLTESELIFGIRRTIRLQLAEIDKIIVGIPREYPMEKFANPMQQQLFATQRNLSLLLVFRDGTLLPLYLYLIPHGSELMSELESRFQNRLVKNYTYTPDAIRVLKRVDLNALIRSSGLQTTQF